MIVSDLSEPDAPARLLEAAGEVDVLVANAGLPGSGKLNSFTPEQIDRALDVNLRAPMLLAHGLIEPMVARGSGHLLFMSSLSGRAAAPGSSVYSATKFGLRGFALALREDLAPKGVGVSVVLPWRRPSPRTGRQPPPWAPSSPAKASSGGASKASRAASGRRPAHPSRRTRRLRP